MIVQVSKFSMNVHMYQTLLGLLKEYVESEDVTGDQFIEAKLADNLQDLTHEEIENLVLLIAQKRFLETIKNHIVEIYKLRHHNNVELIMFLFFILFVVNDSNSNESLKLFKEIKFMHKRRILHYFSKEDNQIKVALIGCKFFEDDYVLKHVIHPLLNKANLLKKFKEYLDQEQEQKRKKKPVTVPQQMMVLQRIKVTPTAPLNTPAENQEFQATPVPKSLYIGSDIERKLAGEFEKNRMKAQQLLAEAKSLTTHYSKTYKSEAATQEPGQNVFKAKKAPILKSNVEVKGNIATVLREATLCVKEKEREIQNIETILSGGSPVEKVREIEENARRLEQKKMMEEIEVKHLEGLLTFEEAILAKKKLIEANKERFVKFMEERQEFLLQMEEWRQKEHEKIMMLVKKGQEIERSAKESEKRLKEERRNRAEQVKDETKQLLNEAYAQKREELAKKVKLIEEIKTLHQLKMLNQTKEVHPTEGPQLGPLCQMSIGELQEKLKAMKMKMQQQLEQKRRCIREYKEKRRQMVENVKNFIAQARMSKPKTVPIRPTKLERSPDLDKLKSQLEFARQLRKNLL